LAIISGKKELGIRIAERAAVGLVESNVANELDFSITEVSKSCLR
jgi:hypothetical protein